jgi:hypothetical protein
MSRPEPTKLDVIEEAPGQIACFYSSLQNSDNFLLQQAQALRQQEKLKSPISLYYK